MLFPNHLARASGLFMPCDSITPTDFLPDPYQYAGDFYQVPDDNFLRSYDVHQHSYCHASIVTVSDYARSRSGTPSSPLHRRHGGQTRKNVPRAPTIPPLAAAGELVKTKKSRSKLGCDGCRKRKKKCDELKPKCGCCRKKETPCTYPVKQYIQQRRLASPTVARPGTVWPFEDTPGPSISPPQLFTPLPYDDTPMNPFEFETTLPQTRPFLKNLDQYLLDHFRTSLSGNLILGYFTIDATNGTTQTNSFRLADLLIPLMAYTSITYGILSVAAIHLSKTDPRSTYAAIYADQAAQYMALSVPFLVTHPDDINQVLKQEDMNELALAQLLLMWLSPYVSGDFVEASYRWKDLCDVAGKKGKALATSERVFERDLWAFINRPFVSLGAALAGLA